MKWLILVTPPPTPPEMGICLKKKGAAIKGSGKSAKCFILSPLLMRPPNRDSVE